MTKSELKTGMIVTSREGVKYIVFLNTGIGADDSFIISNNETNWNFLSNYKEDLTERFQHKNLDIVKVEKCKFGSELLNNNPGTTTIWERKEKKTYTYEQLKEILGAEFEVVG